MKYITNIFYCMNCGRESIPLSRKKNKLHTKFHKKELYCPWCKETLNHIEIRNDKEKEEFLEMFQAGAFIEEAQESIKHCKEKGSMLL